jgi:hypothetical protein
LPAASISDSLGALDEAFFVDVIVEFHGQTSPRPLSPKLAGVASG